MTSAPSCSFPFGKKWYSEPKGALAAATISFRPVPWKPWRRNSSALAPMRRSLVLANRLSLLRAAVRERLDRYTRSIYQGFRFGARNEEGAMGEVELSAGTIEYQDTGGEGPVIVLLHGLAMDGSVWRHVVGEL